MLALAARRTIVAALRFIVLSSVASMRLQRKSVFGAYTEQRLNSFLMSEKPAKEFVRTDHGHPPIVSIVFNIDAP
jgi:hypothetical protein